MCAADVTTSTILLLQVLLTRQKDCTHHVAFLAVDSSMDMQAAQTPDQFLIGIEDRAGNSAWRILEEITYVLGKRNELFPL